MVAVTRNTTAEAEEEEEEGQVAEMIIVVTADHRPRTDTGAVIRAQDLTAHVVDIEESTVGGVLSSPCLRSNLV